MEEEITGQECCPGISWAPGKELSPTSVSPRMGQYVLSCYSLSLSLAGDTAKECLGMGVSSDTSYLPGGAPRAQSQGGRLSLTPSQRASSPRQAEVSESQQVDEVLACWRCSWLKPTTPYPSRGPGMGSQAQLTSFRGRSGEPDHSCGP